MLSSSQLGERGGEENRQTGQQFFILVYEVTYLLFYSVGNMSVDVEAARIIIQCLLHYSEENFLKREKKAIERLRMNHWLNKMKIFTSLSYRFIHSIMHS